MGKGKKKKKKEIAFLSSFYKAASRAGGNGGSDEVYSILIHHQSFSNCRARRFIGKNATSEEMQQALWISVRAGPGRRSVRPCLP